MSRLLITGDRTLSPVYPTMVLVEMLRAVSNGQDIITGTNDGVEALVRSAGQEADVPVAVIENPTTPEGWIDWDARHAGISEDTTVLVIHADVHESRVGKSVLNTVPEDRVKLVTLADLL
jgi:hypothetical protein